MIDKSVSTDDIQNLAGMAEDESAPDLSSGSAGPDGSETADGMVPRSELQKVIRQRQAAKLRARQAEQRLESVLGPEGDMESETENADKGVSNVSKKSAGPQKPELEILRQKLDRSRSQLADLVRHRSLRLAAESAGAVNPDQVVAMLKDRVVMAEADDGSLTPRCLDESGEVLCDEQGRATGVEALVKSFMSRSENANLLLPTALPGSGARPVGFGQHGQASSLSLGGFNSLSPDQRRKVALTMDRTQRERMLGISRNGNSAYL